MLDNAVPGSHMYLITTELRAPSVPPGLGPPDLSPQNSYFKAAWSPPKPFSWSFATVKIPTVTT